MASLWERMGGEAKIKPMLDYAYDRYSTDPLSAYTFGKGKGGNHGDADMIKKHVLDFFSAGIGGGAAYAGRDMTACHVGLGIDEVAYHGLTACFLEAFEKFGTGGRKEWCEVLAILVSLHDPVMGDSNPAPKAASGDSLWDRMGGEGKIRPMLDDAYDQYSTNPLSAYTFGAGKAGNHGDAGKIKEHVFTFFSAGIGGGHAYAGRDMVSCHAGLKIDEVAYYQLNYCFLRAFEKHKTGGRAEWCECLAILNSLHDQVMEKTNDIV